MEKLMKTARALDTFFKLVFWITVIFGGIVMIANLVMLILGPDWMRAHAAQGSWYITGYGFRVPFQLADTDSFPMLWRVGAAVFLVAWAAICWILHTIRRILAPMKEGQPFADGVADDLKKLAWTVLIFGLISAVWRFVSQVMVSTAMSGSLSVNSHYAVGEVVNLDFLLVAAVLFLVSYIFRYGRELQVQSDETL